jgi:hypothetical protein
MSDIKKINQSDYVTVQGQYAVINEGTGYAIINIQTKQIAARNISSFLDCVKTLEYIIGNCSTRLTSSRRRQRMVGFCYDRTAPPR